MPLKFDCEFVTRCCHGVLRVQEIRPGNGLQDRQCYKSCCCDKHLCHYMPTPPPPHCGVGYGWRCRTCPLRRRMLCGCRIPVDHQCSSGIWMENYGCERATRAGRYGFDVGTTSASAVLPCCSPACSERLTTACASSGWSRPLLPDHAELAASEQAEHDAAGARLGGKPICRVLSARIDKMTVTYRRRRPADSIVSRAPPRQPIVDLMLLPRNACRAMMPVSLSL
jgi:hypothetical protein